MLELSHITVTFSAQGRCLTAVDDVSLKVKSGEICGIVGASGAGKSTLLRTVNLLQRPSAGQVLLKGEDLTKVSRARLEEVRRGIGMIFQHFNLVRNITARANVEFALKAAGVHGPELKARAEDLLSQVGLSGRGEAYPAQLSGGQKQRVAIARALANDPELLLCDEATSALDPDTTREIVTLLRRIQRERSLTVLFITHQLDVAKQLFDHTAVMDKGRFIEEGSSFEVFSSVKNKQAAAILRQGENLELPDEVKERCPNLYLVTYKRSNAYEGIIAQCVRSFEIDLSIVAGGIEYIEQRPLGRLVISLSGSRQERLKALNFLCTHAEVSTIKETLQDA